MFPEYSGMTYEQASREADRVLRDYGWYKGLNRLIELKAIMQNYLESDAKPTVATTAS